MTRGCPDCMVTQMYDQFKEELAEEFDRLAERRKRAPGSWPWTMEKILSDVGVAASADASVDGAGYRGSWPVPLRRLVVILREERGNLRKAKDAELKAQLKREADGGRRSGK